jgi:cell division protein FtsW
MRSLIDRYIRGDRIIWGLMAALSIFSLLAVYSSTGTLAYKYHGGNTMHYMLKHLMFVLMGMVAAIIIHKMHYKVFAKTAKGILWISILLLGLTLVMGVSLNQASRWLTVPGLGWSFQPSELAKFSLIIFIARVLSQHQEEGKVVKDAFWPILGYVVIVCGLIFRENLSTALMIGSVCVTMMFIGRIPFKYLLATAAAALAIGAIVLALSSYVPFLHRAETWKARLERFVGGDDNRIEKDNAGDFQSNQAKIAVATGGLIGKGPGNSYQRNFLPHPYSDFIFAIIVEEFGFVGGFFVMLIYLTLLFRAALIVKHSTKTFPAFTAIGLTLLLVVQSFINMGVAVGFFPVTGQTLPLVSMGGTSVIFTFAAFGVILSVSRCNIEESEPDKQKQGNKATKADAEPVAVGGEM